MAGWTRKALKEAALHDILRPSPQNGISVDNYKNKNLMVLSGIQNLQYDSAYDKF